jgi:sugar lactone lactonase YvrE
MPQAKVLYSGPGKLESVAVDRKGRVFFTDSGAGTLMRLRTDGRPPRVLLSGIEGPGGIVFTHRKVLVGFGDSAEQGLDGLLAPEAGLIKVDPRTGESETVVEGLQMANGVARAPGAIFASTDFGTGIDRIVHGKVELEWATLASPNGMIAAADGKSLFVNQTFTTPSIMRVPLANPAAMSPWYANHLPEDAAAGLDGITRGDGNTLYTAANGGGEVWRVDGPDDACVLLHRDPFPSGPSDLAFGRGRGIADSSLLVTTFGGELLEIPAAR